MSSEKSIKQFEEIDFPRLCNRIIKFNTTVIFDKEGKDVHNNKKAWKIFMDNETERFTELNNANGEGDIIITYLSNIDYGFVAPWLSRYENASENNKDIVLNEFIKAMLQKWNELRS